MTSSKLTILSAMNGLVEICIYGSPFFRIYKVDHRKRANHPTNQPTNKQTNKQTKQLSLELCSVVPSPGLSTPNRFQA